MTEIIWRIGPSPAGPLPPVPDDAAARARLAPGNARLAALNGPDEPGATLTQDPFAAVLSCSDARVPIELVCGQATNDLFVVRVAGKVPGAECVGSLNLARPIAAPSRGRRGGLVP